MAYLTRELITRAWYLSGVVSRDLETVSGDQLNDGLQMLNALLSIKTANQRLIPYYKEYDFTAQINVETYFVPDLVFAESLTFNIGPVRYYIRPQNRKNYFGNYRVDNIDSLPYSWHYERVLNGANVYLYFLPNQQYPMKLWGKFSWPEITSLDQDLSLEFDKFYIEYLRYGLAEYMCQEYNIIFQPQNSKRLSELENMIFDISPIDLTMDKSSMLQRNQYGINYGIVNLSQGWV